MEAAEITRDVLMYFLHYRCGWQPDLPIICAIAVPTSSTPAVLRNRCFISFSSP